MEWASNYRYDPTPRFDQLFWCLPFSKNSNPNLQTSDKIILPPSARAGIVQLGFNSPKICHCGGVLQFDAEEDTVHLPDWMIKNLSLPEGALVILRNTWLLRGEYMKLQPHTTSFMDLANPEAVMKQGLGGFTCLSRGDTFMIKHGDTDFWFNVVEVYPGDAISLIDTNFSLDFAPPLLYKEPDESGKQRIVEEVKVFRPSSGAARRLKGTAVMGGAAVVVKEEKKREKGGKEDRTVQTGVVFSEEDLFSEF